MKRKYPNTTELSLAAIQINNIADQLKQSNKKLEFLDGRERTKELYHNGNLHLELRKFTTIANQQYGVFYCSICGELFKDTIPRTIHVKEEHIEKI